MRKESAAQWWKTYFDADYLDEFGPLMGLEYTRRQVSRLVDVLGLPVGARLLDLACGQGRHAHGLAEAGFDVTGFDYSADLLGVARRRGVGSTLRYVRGDMRKLPARWTSRFGGVVNLFTSFGFFDDPVDDARVIAEVARTLKPGGVFVWHGGSRDGVVGRFVAHDSWRSQSGTVVEHDRELDVLTGVLTIRTTLRRRNKAPRREHRIRLYTATRMAELFAAVGLTLEAAYDGFNDAPLARRSGEMMLVARKR
ncbi:MAG: methyltransferase domain-containing protein [Gemmatimonadota bacterium]|nr:methyltransferase domain-containing protein [Gemmatimonadota bacterium]